MKALSMLVLILTTTFFCEIGMTNNQYQYIITNVGEPDSFAPLDGDKWQNMPLARMIYLTPIEISSEDELVSTILESFTYDQKKKKMEWTVKSGLTYNNGEKITVEDVVFSVLRMMYRMPLFPVIKNILGIDNWKKGPDPLNSLPEGIKVSRNNIEIFFNKKIKAPFFRFCLELFSIIPKRCVDTKTNKLICSIPPSSGHYELASNQKSKWFFKLRSKNGKINKTIAPKEIEFSLKVVTFFFCPL